MATETRMDAELTLGRHEAVTGELETLTSANPMRERLWSQRMLALTAVAARWRHCGCSRTCG